MAVITEVNNYVAKFFNLSHLKYDTFSRPSSRAMSTPVKESPLLDGAVETLRARHLGGAGQTVGGHPPSCSQTPSSPQTFQVPWQLCSADHVSCWAVGEGNLSLDLTTAG